MIQTRALALILLFPLTGCIDLPGIDDLPPEEEPTAPSNPDTGMPDAGPREPLEVRWVTPAETVYTNGLVDLKLEVTGGTADTVELYAGDVRLAVLASPYAFTWDTTSMPEGSYALNATAKRGGLAFTSESRPVVIDRTPPHVVERTPEPGAQNVSARQTLQVTFSEPMQPADITPASVRLASVDAEYPKSLSLSGGGTVLVVKPDSALSAPALISVTFAAPMRDLAGNALVAPSQAWSWEVPAWLPVGTVLSALPDPAGDSWGRTTAQHPSLQVDANGLPVVAWQDTELVQNSVAKTRIFVSRWTGEAWSLTGSSPSTASHPLSGAPSLQLDALGRPVVAWDEYSIHVSRWDGIAWQKVGDPFHGAANYYISVRPPVLQLKTGDVPVVAWGESDDAHAATWTGGEWASLGSTLSAYASAGIENRLNALRLDKQGNPVVAWDEQNPENSANTTQVWKLSGGDWVRFPELSTPLKAWLGPSLVLDGEDNPILAWMETETGAPPAVQVTRWVGTGWQQLGEKIPLPAKSRASIIALQVLPSGNPILAFLGADDTESNKVHVWYWVDGSWKPLGGGLSAPTGSSSVGGIPSLALDSTGLPYLAWEQFDGWTTNIHVYRLNR